MILSKWYSRQLGITVGLLACAVLFINSCAQVRAPGESPGQEGVLPGEELQEDGESSVYLPHVSKENEGFQDEEPVDFNGERAYQDVLTQDAFGPRTVGSDAHQQFLDWASVELEESGWVTEILTATKLEHPIKNLAAKRPQATGKPVVIIGAHYDSRLVADQDSDPAKRDDPVPGANDGASGAAVLLELARVLPEDLNADIWLVFFDAEDNGNIEGWDWILGSSAFVESLEITPEAAIVVDMIGDADLNIYKERTSNSEINDEIWAKAAELGYAGQFIDEDKYSVLDDHTPFLRAGIPAVDIIDFDYPYWHTTQDTADKVSAPSLEAVGETLIGWLVDRYPPAE